MVPAIHATLRIVGYRRTRISLDRWTSGRLADEPAPRTPSPVEALALATTRVQRYSWLPGNCLSRSLALYTLLRGTGAAPTLRLGVSLADSTFAAHAWVELDGRVLNDQPDVSKRYRPLD